MRKFILTAMLVAAASPLSGAEQETSFALPVPSSIADVWQQNEDGSVRHIRSNLACPADLPNMKLWHVFVYPSPDRGADVGCDYGRIAAVMKTGGRTTPEAKLSIYAVHAPDGMTLDQAFARYHDEMHNY